MTVVASGQTVEADYWQLRVSTDPDTGDLTTVEDIQLADGSNVWGGGYRDAVPPGNHLTKLAREKEASGGLKWAPACPRPRIGTSGRPDSGMSVRSHGPLDAPRDMPARHC
jgi:hypothetical protein